MERTLTQEKRVIQHHQHVCRDGSIWGVCYQREVASCWWRLIDPNRAPPPLLRLPWPGLGHANCTEKGADLIPVTPHNTTIRNGVSLQNSFSRSRLCYLFQLCLRLPFINFLSACVPVIGFNSINLFKL